MIHYVVVYVYVFLFANEFAQPHAESSIGWKFLVFCLHEKENSKKKKPVLSESSCDRLGNNSEMTPAYINPTTNQKETQTIEICSCCCREFHKWWLEWHWRNGYYFQINNQNGRQNWLIALFLLITENTWQLQCVENYYTNRHWSTLNLSVRVSVKLNLDLVANEQHENKIRRVGVKRHEHCDEFRVGRQIEVVLMVKLVEFKSKF